MANLDADEPLEDSDRESSDEDEDDTAELMAELNRIKKEREAEQVWHRTNSQQFYIEQHLSLNFRLVLFNMVFLRDSTWPF